MPPGVRGSDAGDTPPCGGRRPDRDRWAGASRAYPLGTGAHATKIGWTPARADRGTVLRIFEMRENGIIRFDDLTDATEGPLTDPAAQVACAYVTSDINRAMLRKAAFEVFNA